MAFLLDTNVWVGILRGKAPELVQRVSSVADSSEILLCSVVKSELIYGAMRSDRVEKNLGLIGELIDVYSSLPFDDRCAESYCQIRIDLERKGVMIGAHDCMIAAIALANDLTLVTRNMKEFSRVDRLRIEDWQGA